MNLINDIEEFKLKYDGDIFFIMNNKLSEDVLEYYIENYKANWFDISKYQTLTESFIIKYIDNINWYLISGNQTLSESFIDKYMDKVNWIGISYKQILSESFIIKYSDKVDWDYISAYQTLSESFIIRHIDKLKWVGLFANKKTSMRYEFLVTHLYKFNLYAVSINNNVDRLIKEFPDKYSIDKLAYEFNRNNRRI